MVAMDIKLARLERMVATANEHLRAILPQPCLDHDCSEHAWWDPECDHTGCTIENPNIVEVDGRRYARRNVLSFVTDWTSDTITAQLDEHGNVWILEPIDEKGS